MDFFVIYMILFFLMVFTLIIIHEKNKIRTNDSITQRYIIVYALGGIIQFSLFISLLFYVDAFLMWKMFFLLITGVFLGLIFSNFEFKEIIKKISDNKIIVKKNQHSKKFFFIFTIILVIVALVMIYEYLDINFVYAEKFIESNDITILALSFTVTHSISMIIKIMKYELQNGKLFLVREL